MSHVTVRGAKAPKSRRNRTTNRLQEKNKEALWSLLCWLLVSQRLFQEITLHGNIKWKPEEVAIQALFWSWLEAQNVTDAFDQCLEICEDLGLKHIAKTYNSFMNALTRYRALFDEVIRGQFHTLSQTAGGRFFRSDDWVPIGFDGSRVTTPRTVSNEKAFCAPNYGNGVRAKYGKKLSKGMRRKRNQQNKASPQAPQIWVTLMWHMGLNLPWTWRLGPSNSSERDHVRNMLCREKFPENTLFCGDAGFIGYPVWSSILNSGGNFLVRVGGNVKLLYKQSNVKQLRGGIVLCWPKERMNSGDPPLRLRLISVKIGKTKMWMLTSVTDSNRLSKKQVVRLYKMRWGIEVEFRGLKQTIAKRKLRCRNNDRALTELDWAIRAIAIAKLLALREQVKATRQEKTKDKYDPGQLSLANTMRVLRRCLNKLKRRPLENHSLIDELADARVQRYKNKASKRARYRPKNPHKKPLSDPVVRAMTKKERDKLRIYQQATAA